MTTTDNPKPKVSLSQKKHAALRAANARSTVASSVPLGGAYAQAAYRRGLSRFDDAMVNIALGLPHILSPDEFDQVLEIVAGKIDRTHHEIDAEIERVKLLRENLDVSAETTFAARVTFAVAINTPETTRFVAFLTKLDQLQLLVDSLWLSGRIPIRKRHELLIDWQRRLIRLAEEIRKISRRAINSQAAWEEVTEEEEDEVAA